MKNYTTVHSMYFSGTGNTELVCNLISDIISDTCQIPKEKFDFTPKNARASAKSFTSSDIVVFGTPVIAGRVPNVLLKYLDTLSGNGALAIPIVTYGNRNYDDGLIELAEILKSKGFVIIAGGAFIGEHSFSTILGKNRPDESDIAIIKKFGQDISAKVKILDENPTVDSIKVGGCDPIRPYYTPRDRNGNPINILKVKPKTNDKCINCLICAAVCPMGSIPFDNVKEVTGICMKCCACVKKCPVDAKYFDDANYLYHKTELEEIYGPVRREPEIFI